MSATYAGPSVRAVAIVGACTWSWHWEDVTLVCGERAIPGGAECADHLVERVHAEGQPR